MPVILPPLDSTAEHMDQKGRPSKDFFNWIKSIGDYVQKGFPSLVVGDPTGGNKGDGSINAESIYVNGVPVNADPQLSSLLLLRQVSASTTLVLTDRSRGIGAVMGAAGQTITVPANASVAFPVGTTVSFGSFGGGQPFTLVPAAGVTMVWVPSGATGTRNIGFASVGTLWQVSPNYWLLTGSGIT